MVHEQHREAVQKCSCRGYVSQPLAPVPARDDVGKKNRVKTGATTAQHVPTCRCGSTACRLSARALPFSPFPGVKIRSTSQ